MEFLFDAGMPRLSHWHTIASTYLMDWVLPEGRTNHSRNAERNVTEKMREARPKPGGKGFRKWFSDPYQSSAEAAVSQRSKMSWG